MTDAHGPDRPAPDSQASGPARADVRIRDAVASDAPAIAAMANALCRVIHGTDGPMTAARVTDDLLGARDLGLLVAETDGQAVGYALYGAAYETAFAARGLYLADLYVEAEHRRAGIARKLIAEIARRADAADASFVWWIAPPGNRAANDAYDRLGAIRDEVLARAVYGDPFERLLEDR